MPGADGVCKDLRRGGLLAGGGLDIAVTEQVHRGVRERDRNDVEEDVHGGYAGRRFQPGHVRVLYISPLKALTYDVERNLRAPLTGIGLAAQRLGDGSAADLASPAGPATPPRRTAARSPATPPDILITTPESLYLLLTSQAREILRGVEHVIVDEVHAIAGTKRGAHLALSLERLEALRPEGTEPPQRIGLSATQRPLDAIARFLGGIGPDREVTIVDAGARKPLELQVVVPVDDMSAIGDVLPQEQQPGGPAISPDLRTSIWPAIHPRHPRADPEPHAARSSSPTAAG